MLGKLLLNRTTLYYSTVIIVCLSIWVKIAGLKNEIRDLEKAVLEKDLIISEHKLEIERRAGNEALLKSKIDKVNAVIEDMRLDNEKLKREVERWKNSPPKHVQNVITNVVPDRKITEENCRKTMFNLKNLNYNDL